MSYGDVALASTLDFKFYTTDADGALITLAGSPVISAYVGNSTTQITAGITLTVDFDGVTGLHHVRVVASGGNGYTTGTDVDLVITTGTVDGTSVVGYTVGSFSIAHRSVASVAADVWAVATRTLTAASDSSGVTTLLTRVTAAVALESSLQGLITTIGASAAGVATAVWSAVTRTLTAGTNIVLAKGTGVTGFNDLSAAQVNTEADTALADAGVTTTVTGRIDAAITSRLASGSYAAAPSAATVATQVRAELTTELGRLDAAVTTRLATGTVSSDLTAVKAKSDKLTFDASNRVEANATAINDTALTGDGTSGTPWGPA
jgi:hypothetical protein